jgi:hypothetical protein
MMIIKKTVQEIGCGTERVFGQPRHALRDPETPRPISCASPLVVPVNASILASSSVMNADSNP